MTPPRDVPPGFTVVEDAGATLVARAAAVEPLIRAGLGTVAGWSRRTDGDTAGSGRGAVASLEVDGRPLVLKQMRRGGLLAPLWNQRYPGQGRLMDNLNVPLEVARRGVATAEPVALLLVPGPPGLYRGWLATARIVGAQDLARGLASASRPGPSEWQTVLALVRRMHDAGVDHPDLNLGNLLLCPGPAGAEAFVIDLDRVVLADAPLPFAARQRAVRRLERSFAKLFGDRSDAPDWYGLYAAGQPDLEDAFRRGRAVGRLLGRLHRLGWPD